jgi:hypothetical protein
MILALMGAVSLWAAASAAQAPDTLWARTYGELSYNDVAYSIEGHSLGGYALCGYTKSYGAGKTDVFLLATDADGDTLWIRAYGGSNNDSGACLRRTSDDGYVVVGRTLSFGAGSYDFYVIKTDSNGDSLWTRTYGGSGWDETRYVEQTSDGCFVIVGVSSSFEPGGDAYIVKIDASGDTLWTRSYGGSGYDCFNCVKEADNGDLIMAGFTSSFGAVGYDAYLVRTDANGDSLWMRTYGGDFIDKVQSVCETADGGYILGGYTQPPAGNLAYVIRTDAVGDTSWTRTYDADYVYSVEHRSDGDFVATGFTTKSGAGGQDLYLARINPAGDTIWTRTYGGPHSDVGHSILITPDNGYAIAGGLDPQGYGKFEAWLLRMAPDCAGIGPGRLDEDIIVKLSGTPNPFRDRVLIEYSLSRAVNVRMGLYDVLGREVTYIIDGAHQVGNHAVSWDGRDESGRNMPSGLYLLRFEAGGRSVTRKLFLAR